MNRAFELVGAGGQGGHLVRLLRRAGDGLAVEQLGPVGAEDVAVVRVLVVLVVEREREVLAGGRLALGRRELPALGRDGHPTAGADRPPRGGRTAGARGLA